MRSTLRDLARLLIEIRSRSTLQTVEDKIDPKYCSIILAAAKALAVYDPQTNLFQKPSVALIIGTGYTKIIGGLLTVTELT